MAVVERLKNGEDLTSIKSMSAMFGKTDDAVERRFLWPKLFMLWNYVMMQIMGAMENERPFSLFKMIETGRRNGLESETINCLMRIANYGPSPSDFYSSPLIDQVVDLWYASGGRFANLGEQKKSATVGVPASVLSSIRTGKRHRDEVLPDVDTTLKFLPLWSFSGAVYRRRRK